MLPLGHSLLLILLLFASCYAVNYGYLYLQRDDRDEIDDKELMNRVMGTIFIVFGSLKVVNLKGFAKIFAKYDIVSKHISIYGYMYPFIEILLGVSFFYKDYRMKSYILTIILMIVSLIGVFLSLGKGVSLRCGCLGSFLHVPLSYVTVSENIVMLAMASYLLRSPL
jgi:hypothetical protein